MRRHVRKAFTLVEILIVVVILGILAAIVVPQFTNATQDAQAGNIKAQLSTINQQVELFKARTNAYPRFLGSGLAAAHRRRLPQDRPRQPLQRQERHRLQRRRRRLALVPLGLRRHR